MKTFPQEIREEMYEACNGYCQCCPTCAERATEFHHLLPNTKVFNKLYPLFIHSPFNCCPINHKCHMNKPKRKMPENVAYVYEKYLKEITKWKDG